MYLSLSSIPDISEHQRLLSESVAVRLLAQSSHALSAQAPDRLQKLESAVDPSILVNFQVHEPVLTPTGPSDELGCVHSQLLMEHVFAFSYGNPFVGMKSSSPTRIDLFSSFLYNRKLHASSVRF